MSKRTLIALVLCLAMVLPAAIPALGQDGGAELPDPTPAAVAAADGLTLTGDYYAPLNSEDPGAIGFDHAHDGHLQVLLELDKPARSAL